ncbi:unnamed protein product [Linum tenue]|uniref:Pectinesterase inhibitor domain-containing protein n=1 Tax=Linum tenue TaxID=586396 RepID=A0AAV0I656_9ROSI|nr:unnamed protein product [Linum tenue]
MSPNHPLLLTTLLLLLSTAAAAKSPPPTPLVQRICKTTTDYPLCVEALYADDRTPEADRYVMAFISVGLAYTNATGTRSYISGLAKDHTGRVDRMRLDRCGSDYDAAISRLEIAYNDLNSETYFGLANLSGEAARNATDCQAVFSKSTWRPLGNRNRVLLVLCQVIAYIGKSFTGGGD